jgi:hypothetical protein
VPVLLKMGGAAVGDLARSLDHTAVSCGRDC